MPPSFGVIYLFASKLTPVMITFLNQRLKQCSNQFSYPVQAARQISIMPLNANTINIPFHYSIFFSVGTPLVFSFFLSPQEQIRSTIPKIPSGLLPPAAGTHPLFAPRTHPPPAVASFSEKYTFCGRTVGPTSNTLKMAETLADGNQILLGKHLLGSVYYLLHQVSVKLRDDQPIGNLGGPWWFIQLWLNMYMHRTMGMNL